MYEILPTFAYQNGGECWGSWLWFWASGYAEHYRNDPLGKHPPLRPPETIEFKNPSL